MSIKQLSSTVLKKINLRRLTYNDRLYFQRRIKEILRIQ